MYRSDAEALGKQVAGVQVITELPRGLSLTAQNFVFGSCRIKSTIPSS